ncbi:6390_t:CDS:2 [Diversispora eburnea]|uniref:6390_t:CDS:1 n=1 Tax=Diversispora eburnea TaxID=1213867 RepID=A0A9N8ZMW4_9GLOM|nr:6390_t:CDS:2 [Diversispora eburnea]
MECSVCKGPTKLCCSRCMKSYYCSRMCQKKDYSKHKIECSPRSADLLVTSVFDDLIPTNEAVLYEYGFNNCIENTRDQCMMLGLYAGLHIYTDHETNAHFLKTIDISNLSERDQKVPFESFSEPKRHIIGLYIIILTNCIPRIELDSWIDFGFASCKYDDDWIGEKEVQLLSLYRELIIKKNCKIDEFNDAYVSGKVLDLLKRKCDNNPWLSENKLVLRGYRQSMKSVYSLKQYVLCEFLGLVNPLRVDYGFMNYRTENEIKNMYPKFDPQELREACIKGKIFNYVKSILPSNELKPIF